jgi:hypothetical protein
VAGVSPIEDFVPSDQYSSYNAPDEGPSVAGYASIPIAWLVPGLGHFLIGERARGIVFFLTIHLLFAGGLLIGGMRSIKPAEQPIWTYTQYLAGWPMLVSNKLWDGFQRNYLPGTNGSKSAAEIAFDRDAPPVPDLHGEPKERIQYTKDFIAAHPLFAFHPKVHDMGSVFCGIAGMLNLLVMFDVLLRVTGSVREDPAAARRKMREAAKATATHPATPALPPSPPSPQLPPATGGTP